MLARPARYASYLVLVHRPAPLLHAAFRPRLTTTPLRFAMTSPPSGCQRDLHPQAVEHARRTWFWGLLPKQKACPEPSRRGLACRGETRPHRTARGHESGGHTRELFTCQRLFTGNPQEEFPISNVKLSGQNHKF